MSGRPVDEAVRERIRTDTAATLFVNAGAGSGKTTMLVQRVRTLVLADGIRLANIAAVTFTEKAGAELRDRLRSEFESVRGDAGLRKVADAALDDLDGAAIGTLHSFAQRILAEHPIEAGLPPLVDVLDEVGSSVAFEERWSELQAQLLDDDAIAEPLLLGMALGLTLTHVRSLALLLGKDWDLIENRVLTPPQPEMVLPDLDDLLADIRSVVAQSGHCTDETDRFLPRLADLGELGERAAASSDTGSALATLSSIRSLKFSYGQKGNWSVPLGGVKQRCADLVDRVGTCVTGVLDVCLRRVTAWLGRQVLESAQSRRRAGTLEFHDLLVLARDLLRRNDDVRAALHEDYERLLLDEFQDTDPIQVELAARICGGRDADADEWQDIVIPAGRLFVVGDAKQSIYRFRRADIGVYLQAQQRIGELVELSTNFRTVEPVLGWINAVFGALIQEQAGAQPSYHPLALARDDTGAGPGVTVLGAEPHSDLPRAAAAVLRQREAADVAGIIRQAIDEHWQIHDQRAGQWRDAQPSDIAVLVPARTSLPFLEESLDAADIPYRAEASSLVYQADEVRSLLACARAIADTTDSLSLVTALRSPLFGCGDDDLWRWKRAGGRFMVFSELPGEHAEGGPVGTALGYLRSFSHRARWLTASEVLGAIVADRRMLEVAATGPRARDGWRRLRFVVDQARAWSEVSHGGLRAYLAWAAHQGQEVSRVAEAVLPETDADSVRVMTIHAAKGLEFPIVILSGLTAQQQNRSGVCVLWPPAGGYEAKIRSGVQTGDFAAALPIDEQMDSAERLRLLYVAATRARDHLVVSLHRSATPSTRTAAKVIADAGCATAADASSFTAAPLDRDQHPQGTVGSPPPPPYPQWIAGIERSRTSSRFVPTISASGLEGTEPEVVLDPAYEAGAAKGARDLALPPWSKGRYGSAIGRAVHAVLQVIDLRTGDGLKEAVAAQVAAEGVLGQEDLVGSLVRSALGSDLVQRAAWRTHWRETYVGTVRDDGILLEGYIDLIFRDDDESLVVVDYKTDAVSAGGIPSRVTYYAPQMAAYHEALAAATGQPVSCSLLFLHPTGSHAAPVAAQLDSA